MMTRFKNFLAALGSEVQNTENAFAQLGENFNVHRATGKNLDLFGDDIQLARLGGEQDDEYRQRILETWVLLRSNGAPDEMLVAGWLLSGSSVVHLRESPAGYGRLLYLSINSNITGRANTIHYGKAAGIMFELVLTGYGAPAAPSFVGAESDDPEALSPDSLGWDDGLGFSELDCSDPDAEIMLWSGGQVSELISH